MLLRLPGVEDLYVVEGTPVLYHARSGSILLADLHLGYEQAMAELGVFLPRVQLRKALSALEKALDSAKPKRVVIVGDVKHVFDRLLRQEAIEVSRLVGWLREKGVAEVMVVRGNHDNYIQGVVTKSSGEFVEDYVDLGGGVAATHGHKRVGVDAEVLVIGHEHPALQVSVGGSRIKYPAFLLVPRREGGLIVVLPATGVYQTGNPVSLVGDAYLSPYVREEGVVEDAIPVISDESVGALVLPPLRESKAALG